MGNHKRKRIFQILFAVLGVCGLILLIGVNIGSSQMKMKAQGIDLCLLCHPDLKKKFDKPFQHTAVKAGECTGCHNPHAAKSKHLLAKSGGALCYDCHDKEKKKFQLDYVHTPVKTGNCIGCHDPHGSAVKNSLLKEGGDLCFICHAQAKSLQKAKVVHAPFGGGECQNCHDPHASKNRDELLESPDKICQNCHDVKDSKVLKAHYQFPIEKADCTSCHNSHGSEQAGLIRSKAHKVFRECKSCHRMSGPNPEETILKGSDLCYKCHPRKKEDLKKRNAHKAVEQGCVTCHTPHAADDKGLLLGKERGLCLKCHGDIQDRMNRAASVHPLKVEGGRCTICHDPHASQIPRLMARDAIQICTKCHTKHAQFSHPYGQGVIDPRNNQMMTCLSCHNVHGSQQRSILVDNPQRALCIQCHRPEEMEKGPKKAREPRKPAAPGQEAPPGFAPPPQRPQIGPPPVRR